MTVPECMEKMSEPLIKSIFNAVVDAATNKGWSGLHNAADVFGDAQEKDESSDRHLDLEEVLENIEEM